ncbi:MAG: hypothetical protein Q7S84_03415 [bacterium]|nr:hypothetical protein [bacterium]
MSRTRHIGVVSIERYDFMACCMAEGLEVLEKRRRVSSELFPSAVLKCARRFLASAASFCGTNPEPTQAVAGTNFMYADAALELVFREKYETAVVRAILETYLLFLNLLDAKIKQRSPSAGVPRIIFSPNSISLFFRALERHEEIKRSLWYQRIRVPLG